MKDPLARALEDLRRKWVPDRRLGVFEVTVAAAPNGGGARSLVGHTTSRDALAALRRLAGEAGLGAEISRLPDESARAAPAAVVTAALAPLLADPDIHAERVSEALHGECLTVLERRQVGGAGRGDDWLRVRAADGYHAWTHAGYLASGPADWAEDWVERATARSLGAELHGGEARLRLPIGARLVLRWDGSVEAADGRMGTRVAGVVRPEAEVRAEARLVSAAEWAQRWFAGAPYGWGGRTEWGVDCSGLTQATYAARGVSLPRDTDLQSLAGREVSLAPSGDGYEPGDLLFFVERGRFSHVAIWAGAGRVVHSALARGGVTVDDLFGDSPTARRLQGGLVTVRRPEHD